MASTNIPLDHSVSMLLRSGPIKLRCKLDVQGYRMACAYTNDGQTVWVTFLRRINPIHPKKIQRIRFHTAPSLNPNAANLTLKDIDYSTVAKEMGMYVTRDSFEDRALNLWTYNCNLSLKTKQELKGERCTILDEENEANSSDESTDHVSEDDSECQFVMRQEVRKKCTKMTPEQGKAVQEHYLSTVPNKGHVDRELYFRSVRKFGRITEDRLAESAGNEPERSPRLPVTQAPTTLTGVPANLTDLRRSFME